MERVAIPHEVVMIWCLADILLYVVTRLPKSVGEKIMPFEMLVTP